MREIARHPAGRSRPWPALAAAILAAESAVALLRPRERPIAPAPVSARDYFSDEEIALGRAYARPQLALGAARGAVEAALLAAVAAQPPRLLRAPAVHPARAGAATAAAMTLAGTAATLPLGALARRRALRAGLATQSWGGWAGDVARASAIGALLTGAVGAATLTALVRLPRTWWLAAAGGGVALSAAGAFAGPVLLDPVFNRFTPLAPGQTRDDVLALARDAGVDVGEVYEVDASRRTTAANAYVTGLGATKRVVLFDTLLRDYDREQLRLVVAHELAHVSHRDVVRSLAATALVAPFAARAMERVGRLLGVRAGRGATPAAMPRLALALGLVSAPVGLVSARLSRAVERRADTFALRLTGAPQAMIAFQRRIAVRNRADLVPPRWLTALASHPPTLERIGAAVAYRATDRAAGRPDRRTRGGS